MPENIFSGRNIYPLLHFHFFQAKQKNSYVLLFETSQFKKKKTAATPGESILLKFWQNVSNR